MNRTTRLPTALKYVSGSLLLFLFTNSFSANAAAPLHTDDAGALISPAPLCQINVYTLHARNADASGIAPDCNISGDVEWSAAFDRLKQDGSPSQSLLIVQGKTIFRPVEPRNWGWGLNAGVINDITGSPFVQSEYGNLIYGISPVDSLQFDLNMGAIHYRSVGGTPQTLSTTWGAAVERDFGPNLTVVAETYGEQRAPTSWQIGARMPVRTSSNHYFSLAIGNECGAGRDSAWLQIGFTLILDRKPESQAAE